ncbi:alpha/beta fold hydrolase [Solitalea canadensis]|uniref:Putative hydrolase or acyltransferase of alpha/beta superfamily n=1 Tax=Solitalea canadensis (strain ATCC 29591 / DSM 3403 / JCM 21819 / LMG 8368 / NBRC 15130 / NCIMB 12057 / USAM 9D) TaxID=929556 RepID=H8KP69_SOLCM|nr:alpha/beta hydrolase [Solitalea canadensis]AFD05706.1 putative hydrolase or acyltransferase of alpha/beta superfamily [Solitalea canadensis DSM 3403]
MKKITFLIVLFAFILLYINVFAATNQPFEVKVTGKGKHTILFIPGFASSGDVWDETIETFSPDFKCYKLTMPGFAGTKAQENPSLKQWVEDISAFIKTEKINLPIVMGHSMGAVMAMMLAAKHPEQVSKIVIVDGLPCLPAVFNPAFKSNDSPDCNQSINQFTGMSDEAFKKAQNAGIKRLMIDISKFETVVNWTLQSDHRTVGKLFCDMSNIDLRAEIAGIQCPSLVLLEAPFKQFEGAMTAQFAQLKGAHLLYANKGLHFIMFDDKEWYLKQLSAFIK